MRDFAVDHDDKPKKVRGLLCTSCNFILQHHYDLKIIKFLKIHN